jgi:hypothetical protein
MAQTIVTGLTGSISLPGASAQKVASVTVTTGAELLDVSHYGGNGWRTRVQGLKDLAGSAVAFMSKGVAGTDPFSFGESSGAMTITYDTGCSIGFNAVIGNVQIVGEYQGLNIITFNWSKADDAEPTVAWAEGA